MATDVAAVVLAAGEGTRLKSRVPKVLHEVAGVSMIGWSLDAARAVGCAPVLLVVGAGAERVRGTVGDDVLYAHQHERLGTGHAVLQARSALEGRSGAVLVLYGDMPLLRPDTLSDLLDLHREKHPAITMLTVRSEDSMGFGRVVRDAQGRVRQIVEEAVASPEILAFEELNCGVYCFDADWLWSHLSDVPMTQPKGEYYLTDMIELAAEQGLAIEAVTVDDVAEVQGINTRVHLARAEKNMRRRINERHMLAGVTMLDPDSTYIDDSVRIGIDTVIYPNTTLEGDTVIGEECVVGPNAVVRDSQVGDRCRIVASFVEEAVLEEEADIGPFGHLRAGAHLGPGVHMGNYGEVKRAHLGAGTKMGHVSYVGDAEVGENVNIGAGTITCNYDGQRKHRTVIGDDAFIGSGSMLVAPLHIGARAVTGAGSVVTHDVDDDTVAYGVPARPRRGSKTKGEGDERRES